MYKKEYWQQYYKKNREKVLKKSRAIRLANLDKNRKRGLEYYYKNRDEMSEQRHQNYLKRKLEIFNKLGDKCVECGFTDIRALQIDHIHGGGTKERKELKNRTVKRYHDTILSNLIKYQLLCANCNWIKRIDKQEHLKRWKNIDKEAEKEEHVIKD